MITTLHGFTGSPAMWQRLDLGESMHLSIAGHGVDPVPVPPTFDAEVDRLAALLPKQAVHLVGYSLGARLALALGLRQPRRLASLTLIGVSPGLATAEERERRTRADERWCTLLEGHGVEAFADAWQNLPMWTSQSAMPASEQARQRGVRVGHNGAALATCLRRMGLGAMPNLWPHLPEVAVPVHLIVGALDSKFTAIAERMRESLPRSRISVIADAGHNPIFERPDAVAELLRTGELHD